MNWKTDLFRPECNVNIDINAIKIMVLENEW